jgi:hypothetical protein
VHAVDKKDGICCECGDWSEVVVIDRVTLDDKEEEHLDYTPTIIQTPPASPSATPVVPSLADAVGYRPPPTASRYNRLDDFRQYAVYHIDDESDSDDDGFRQTTLASASSSYDEDEW